MSPSRSCAPPVARLTRTQGALALAFVVSGIVHLVRPQVFEQIVPRRLPAPRTLVHVSGVAELACAVGLTYAPTRRLAGLASAALLVAVFPANIQMACSAHRAGSAGRRVITLARLPLQLPLIQAALRAGRPDAAA